MTGQNQCLPDQRMKRIGDCDFLRRNPGTMTPPSGRGSEHAAVMLTLIRTAKLNDVDPQGVLAWIADHKITDLAALLPWNWRDAILVARAA
jgi:hypothetical protein